MLKTSSGALANLEELYLHRNKIGDAGMGALAGACASGGLANLKILYLHRNKIGDDGITALADALESSSGALALCQRIVLSGSLGSDTPVQEALAARKK